MSTPAHHPSGQPPRSDNLLPPESGQDESDARFEVAEEVSLDQQSDQARQLGQLPPDAAPGASVSGALAESLHADSQSEPAAKLADAIERGAAPL